MHAAKYGIEVVLAVGGGSVIDASKVIAAGANYDGDAWELVKDNKKIGKVLPIVTILTLAATGSEMNKNAVISNMATNEKLGTSSHYFKPVASICDPTYLFTLPARQTAAGTADPVMLRRQWCLEQLLPPEKFLYNILCRIRSVFFMMRKRPLSEP